MKTQSKAQLAKFGIFEIEEGGTMPKLYRARSDKGKPFQTTREANQYLIDHIKPFREFEGRNLYVAKISDL